MRGARRRALTLAALGAAATVLMAGCLQNPNDGSSASGPDNAETDGDGTVSVLGAFGGSEADLFRASLEAFEEESGITVEYVSDQDFTNTIRAKVGSGQAPDIAIFPQPGGLLEQADAGAVQPVNFFLDLDALDETLVPGLLDAAEGTNRLIYGAPIRMAVKSIVWYPLEAYTAGGYNTEPETLDDLAAVADEIRATGTSPWCMAWGSDQATGWVGTDWIEEYMLRLWGPEVYDQWTSHEIPFNDERVIAAFDAYGEMFDIDNNVLGGSEVVLATDFGNAMLPAFENPPECMMERQGNFVTGFFPDDVQEDLDSNVGIFVFPRMASGEYTEQPILGGGDLAALMNSNDPDAIQVMEFITSDQFGAEWAAGGGWLSPHTTFDTSYYPDDITRATADIVSEADVFRFDGSDLMPNAVGGGSFWTGMVEWLSGTKTAEQVTTDIENSWPVDEEE